MKKNISTKMLLWIPLGVYALSYFYLAFYHKKWLIFATVIHEGGLYNLLETILYAPHFLGHIPVHTILAIYFVGTYLSLTRPQQTNVTKKNVMRLGAILILFLGATVMISLKWFSYEDTIAFILQQKQSAIHYEQGGSWNLHLPSTMMQFLLIPIYIFLIKIIFQRDIWQNSHGDYLMAGAIILFLLITWVLNNNPICTLSIVWKDPRYLAHSVRELLTFPLTYYPIPLYFFLKSEKRMESSIVKDKSLLNKTVALGVVFLALLAYQTSTPLSQGIGELAQKPAFARGGQLPIFYLLSSHYFEHFLDTVYFSILCLILLSLSRGNR